MKKKIKNKKNGHLPKKCFRLYLYWVVLEWQKENLWGRGNGGGRNTSSKKRREKIMNKNKIKIKIKARKKYTEKKNKNKRHKITTSVDKKYI